jgi:uncharacterized phage-associated protein
MTTSAHIIAKFIVQKSEASTISNLKLQKLLYYVQGWHLGIYGVPVFTEEIQAWIHGPVVPAVFQTYREFRWTPIAVDSTPARVDASTSKHVLAVLGAYGKLTAAQLEATSHEEAPWIEARKGLDPKSPSREIITPNSMKRFFGKLAHV